MVDCDVSPNDNACEKPVSTIQKTVIPICIFAGILLIAGIVFLIFIRRRARREREWEEQARRKYQDLFNDDEPQDSTATTNIPQGKKPANDNQTNYSSERQDILGNGNSSRELIYLHPSMDAQRKPTEQRSFV